MVESLHDLTAKGFSEIYADLNEAGAGQRMPIADLLLELA